MKTRFTRATLIVALLLSLACAADAAPGTGMLSSAVDQQSADTTSSSIPEQSSRPKTLFLIGPEASVFFPTSSKTADTYGKSWGSLSVGLGSAYQATVKGTLSPFFTILYNTHNSNRAFVVPAGIAYSKALSPSVSSAYYGLDLLVVAADQRSVVNNVHSGFSYAPGARAAIGYEFGKSAYVQTSYLLASSIKSFNFSGASLEVGIRF